MITIDAVIGGDVKKISIVFDWENEIYEFLLDEGDTKKLIFSGDINYLKEVMKKALNEISKGERK